MSKQKKSTNASPSAFGWVFQVGAGMKLMLDNIKEFTHLKMEGKDDDIELTLPNGKIYAQAKSVIQLGDQSNALNDLKNAARVLKDNSAKEDAIKLVYITNIKNPFSGSSKSDYMYNFVYSFDSLKIEDQQRIREEFGDDFPVEKLEVHILYFYGEKDSKFEKIKEQIGEFLRIAIGDPSFSKKLLDNWFTTFMVDCADIPDPKKKIDLSKEEIITPLIVLAIENPISRSEFEKVSDFDDYDGMMQRYRQFIYNNASVYELYMSVIGQYNAAVSTQLDKRDYKYKFITDKWNDYESYFSIIENEEHREAVAKATLLAIINKRSTINQIQEAAGL